MGDYVLVKSSCEHSREKMSPRRPMCFRCLMLRLSGPTELLFLLCCIASWTWVVVKMMVCLGSFYEQPLSNRSVIFMSAVFDSVCELCVETIAIYLGEVALFLLNVIVQFCGVGAALLERP